MDIVRALLMGFGCFGLLVVGSCAMIGYGTVAVVEKAAEIAEDNRAVKANARASRWDADGVYAADDVDSYEHTAGDNNSKFGEPTMKLD